MEWIMYLSLSVNFIFLVYSFLVGIRKRIKTYAYDKVLRSNQGKILIKKVEERGKKKVLDMLKSEPTFGNFTIRPVLCDLEQNDLILFDSF